MDSSEKNQATKSNLTLWLILAVCVVPILASTALYFLWTPTRFVNHGELLDPVPLAGVAFTRMEGETFDFNDLNGRWVFLSIDDGACDEYCEKKLYLMRQIRLTQGKDADRIERVWLVRDGQQPSVRTLAEYEGTHAVVLANVEELGPFPADGKRSGYISLIDPLGNLMMRYPPDADPSRIKKDIAKLLRVSSGWRQIER